MKIVSWNINGIRTFRGRFQQMLDSLNADIICLQETKVTRDLLDERTAIVEGYNSYFSFSRGRSGYSGVATFCKNSAIPFVAEEGLTGLLSSKGETVGCYGDRTEFSDEELQQLDNEGRAVITQHKITHVIILGDVNTSHKAIDHCDPDDLDSFEDNPGRKWLNNFLFGLVNTADELDDSTSDKGNLQVNKSGSQVEGGGKFVDTFRFFHPNRPNAFTCWSTLTGARQTNYGTRIDYIFANRNLVENEFVDSEIMPEVEGSDHCPVRGELRCFSIASSKCPSLCTKYMPEFAGRQQKLSRFLVKVGQPVKPEEMVEDVPQLPGSQEAEEVRENIRPTLENLVKKRDAQEAPSPVTKRPKSSYTKVKSRQHGSLLAFFKPKLNDVNTKNMPQCNSNINSYQNFEISTEPSQEIGGTRSRALESENDCLTENKHLKTLASRIYTNLSKNEELTDKEINYESDEKESHYFLTSPGHRSSNVEGPLDRSERKGSERANDKQSNIGGKSTEFWKSVLHGPPAPPSCKIHGEPCVLRTVKKAGPNLGKKFFVCARPQGHNSNPEARCNFFLWVEKGK
ncbi:DNA-(apurinic or apyrimidinic site) lyase 2 isoform X2 [Erpetoichthys calabaricus]|uniref:DNA-(apurinic or apyrimidinic site) lyase 2 isoform X2 n=1 Tax=Erpetoichthys calabaricus TaxID=27687 RepID=UPI0022340C26|nr:DNA-(apurinic or apyrimidinic site) lyase 2 isoform X2 [Erpetoichthys calabaricus]